MLISIITVCLNSEKFIVKAMESVVNQDYDELEYIIIDGGSKDSTLDFIKSYQIKYPFIRYISEPDLGISDAFNKGIKMSKGDIIGIINSDDWLEDNILNKISLSFNHGDIIHGKLQYWNNSERGFVFIPNISGIERDMTINHPTVFVKSHIYERFGNFKLDYKFSMDYEIMLRFYLKNVKFYYLDSIISNMSLDGVSDRNWFKGILESRRAKLDNGLNRMTVEFYFIFQILRSSISRLIQTIGFLKILNYYRKHFSIMKKYQNA